MSRHDERIDRELGRAWDLYEQDDGEGAAAALRALLERNLPPADEADARHLLGMVLDEMGDHDGAAAEWLVVLRLDAAAEGRHSRMTAERFEQIAEDALLELPDQMQEWLVNVPVLIDDRPSEEMVADGTDPRLLGLFWGVPVVNQSVLGVPHSQVIYLFQRNLERGASDQKDLARQIRITVIHETAHFFGLDDDELERLGLG